ncbi:heat shock protein 70 family [Cristinia sonorae]|uniref:Heat shock protein 70 family n=1 Tax=Cristinia sonorae TaxID=1940300 RepID=A0A8K0UG82_9AGAR|nr:heat shock protein 70 family [Cristinia sonorae]
MNRILVALLLWLSVVSHSALASVLAIDYGSDWIKASLMSPGTPFDVLLNKDSKRKIQSTVGWKKEDRLFASDAFNIAGRFPTDSFSSLKYLQAAPYDSPAVSYYISISSTELLETSRGTVAFRRSDGSEWSVEELVAMQFAYIRDLAETSLGGEKVTDVILTVPPYYTQHERDAVIDAVEIAGMRTLALIHDGSAVAVNYAMTRTFEKPEYHIIYDAGASSIRASLVSFASVPAEPKSKQLATQITVHGVGYDRQVGGTEMDRRLREMLIREFDKKHHKDIRADRRGMAKLWKEAGRVKAILSANTEAMASVESLAFDIDFRTKVTRADFESVCKDLKQRFASPIYDALDFAGLTMDNITSVILTGGATRTPMLQAAIKAAVGDDKLARNVNTDEAAVLGAALYGAGLSRQFKTKDIRVGDINIHDIQVSYQAEAKAKSDAAKPRTINTVVFPAGSRVGSRKTLTFKRKDNFAIQLNYKNQPLAGYPLDILEAEISGIPEALGNLTERGAIDPVVKATVVLSDSGFVSVQDAVAFGEIKDDSITGKLKGLFGSGSSSDAAPTEQETLARSEAPEDESSSESSATPSPTPTPEKKVSPKDNTIALELKINLSSIPPMSVAQKRASRDRLAAIDREEAAKRRKEEARNSLEGYLYRVRDLLEEDSTTPFMKCSQEQERNSMREKLDETFSWLYDQGDDAQTADYIQKRSAIESIERPVIHRYKEIEEFPKALNSSQMWNWSTRLFLTEAHQNLTASLEDPNAPPSKYTREELDALEKTLREHEAWLHEMVEKQKLVKMNEDPVLESSVLKEKAKKLENHLQRLVKKKPPRVKKPTTSSSASSTSSTSTGEQARETEPAGGHDEL